MATSALKTFSPRITPAWPAGKVPVATQPVKLAASTSYTAGAILGELLGTNEVQILTPGGTISGGTWTITYSGQTTSALAYNATAATIQTALEALSNVGAGNIAVTGGPISSGVVTLTFQNDLGYQNVAAVTVGTGSLTGSSPTLTPSTTTQGATGTDGGYDTYSASSVTGLQTPKAILADTVTTNADGKIINDDGTVSTHATAYLTGSFRSDDVPTITDAILSAKGGRWLVGNAAGGIFQW